MGQGLGSGTPGKCFSTPRECLEHRARTQNPPERAFPALKSTWKGFSSPPNPPGRAFPPLKSTWKGFSRPPGTFHRDLGNFKRHFPASPTTQWISNQPVLQVSPALAAGMGTKSTWKGFPSPPNPPGRAFPAHRELLSVFHRMLTGFGKNKRVISSHDPVLAKSSDFSFCCWRILEGPVQLSPPDRGDALQSPAAPLKPSPAPVRCLQKGSAEGGRAGTRCH